MNCIYHNNNLVSLICIYPPHKCQRKLCVECLYEHGVEVKYAIPIYKFYEQISKEIQDRQLALETFQISQQRDQFKKITSYLQTKMQETLDDFSQLVNKIFDLIEQEDKRYIQLLQRNSKQDDSSFTDLEELVQILFGKKLDDFHNQKNYFSTKLRNCKYELESEINTFSQKIKDYMQQSFSKYLVKQRSFKLNFKSKEFNSFVWNQEHHIFMKAKYQIDITDNYELQYKIDGEKIRTEQIIDNTNQSQLMSNIEQIRFLNWSGKYGQNNRKVGKWTALWKGQILDNVGGEYKLYLEDGTQSGYWKQPIKNYWSLAQVYEVGEYHDDKKKGTWKFIYKDQNIGGGEYNNFGEKEGKWVDIYENFFENAQVIYVGEYNLIGKRVGRWDIFCNYMGQKKLIGGGQYDEKGNQRKIGRWVELDLEFYYEKQITYEGEYNQNGLKVGKWDTMNQGNKMQILQNGGGAYDSEGDLKKIGRWVELDEGFYNQKQIKYHGEYNMNGMKVRRWDAMYDRDGKGEYKFIGGGEYDNEGKQIKFGKWIELDEGFYNFKQVTYDGTYNKNAMKVGRWDILYSAWPEEEYKNIGGGWYDQEGNQKKIGSWIELDKGFYDLKKIIYNVQYNSDGMHAGTPVQMKMV